MPDDRVIERFRRRLLELGCPAGRVTRMVQELADHHADLKSAALEAGLTAAAAEVRADELLGEPVTLAEHFAAVLRNSSWWGRHPLIGFCLLPPVGIVALMFLGLLLMALIGKFYFTPGDISALADPGPEFKYLQWTGTGIYYAAIALTAALFCRLAWRSASGFKWALGACVVCAAHSYCYFIKVEPHLFAIGYSISSRLQNLTATAIPLAVAAVFLVWRWRSNRALARLAPAVAAAGPEPADVPHFKPVHLNLRRPGLLTPSSVIAALLVAAIAWLIGWVWTDFTSHRAREKELKAKIWPAERAVMMAQIQARQSAPVSPQARTIDLKPWLNLSLAEAAARTNNSNDDNLAELPQGIHTFGGMPFDVQGRIALMGRKLADGNRVFPSRARNIAVAQKCARIHLLHGASHLPEDLRGTKVAWLVVHYADGSQRVIDLIAGEHLLDWWGPIYRTGGAGEVGVASAPGTELAWAGSNSAIKQRQPESSLRLYKSTFDNPEPDREISTIDYVSALTDAAPFLVGLTVE